MREDFEILGIDSVRQLKSQDAQHLYDRICKITGTRQDPWCSRYLPMRHRAGAQPEPARRAKRLVVLVSPSQSVRVNRRPPLISQAASAPHAPVAPRLRPIPQWPSVAHLASWPRLRLAVKVQLHIRHRQRCRPIRIFVFPDIPQQISHSGRAEAFRCFPEADRTPPEAAARTGWSARVDRQVTRVMRTRRQLIYQRAGGRA